MSHTTLSKRKNPKSKARNPKQIKGSKFRKRRSLQTSKQSNNRTASNAAHAIKQFPNYIIQFGLILLTLGLAIFILTFYPIIKEEIIFQLASLIGKNDQKSAQIKPIDSRFSIVIPKISANARVFANVDPFNSQNYQPILAKGVAHARGSALPGEVGNVFIFAHSSANWYEANRYNSVFYLLNKLTSDDKIIIYYKNKKYIYRVLQKKIVES